MNYCTKCSEKIENNNNFCANCGSKINLNLNTKEADESINANIKVEVTNVTTEKAFKKVGETLSNGKEAIQTTRGFIKKIFLPFIILLIIGGIGKFLYEKKVDAERDKNYQEYMQIQKEAELEIERELEEAEKEEKQSCVKQTLDRYGSWERVQRLCSLSYIEVEEYQFSYLRATLKKEGKLL